MTWIEWLRVANVVLDIGLVATILMVAPRRSVSPERMAAAEAQTELVRQLLLEVAEQYAMHIESLHEKPARAKLRSLENGGEPE